MFRRKEEDEVPNEENETAEAKTAEKAENAASASTPAASSSTAKESGNVSTLSQPAAAAPASNYRPAPVAAPAAPRATAASPAASGHNSQGQQADKKRRVLTVGNDILLKGEIATCDRLVIEGAVDAKLKEVHTVEIAESGSFKGSAQIEDAEISGLFEGELTVKNRLIIYSTGKVRGKITYGEIEIERGGELTGEINTNASVAEAKAEAKKNKAA